MRKIKTWFQGQQRTVKIAVLFVLCSFVLIIGIGIFHGIQPSNNVDFNIADTENKETHKEKEEILEEIVKEEQPSDEMIENETAEGQKVDSSNNNDGQTLSGTQPSENDNSSNHSNGETDKEEQIPNPVPQIGISITIKGLTGSIILQENSQIQEGSTAYDGLKASCDRNGIIYSTSGYGPYVYVRGINGLNEREHGATSGWMYRVNGESPNVGAASYTLNNGDIVEWYYVHD